MKLRLAIIALAIIGVLGILGSRVGADEPGSKVKWAGVNYWALSGEPGTTKGCNQGSGTRENRLDVLQPAGVQVVRIGGFQSYATDTSGNRTWAQLDDTLADLATYGMQAVVPLGNNWKECEGASTASKSCSWYDTGYKTLTTYAGQTWPQTYRDYVNAVTARYASDPTVKVWEVMNEPRGDGCASGIMHAFFTDIAALIRANDSDTPVSLGGDGDGWDYATENAISDVGIVTFHHYCDASSNSTPSPADRNATAVACAQTPLAGRVATEIAVAKTVGKPVYDGENGINCDQTDVGCSSTSCGGALTPTCAPGSCNEGTPAAYMKAKAKAQLEAGAAGYLAWAYSHSQGAGSCSHDFGPASPKLAIIAALDDTDGDGCPDAKELGTNHATGGQRDPNNYYDFYDVPRPSLGSQGSSSTAYTKDHIITSPDVIAVGSYVGTSAANPNTANGNGFTYGSDWNLNGVADGLEYDRSAGAQTWAPGPPDGVVTIGDQIIANNSNSTNCL